MPIKVTHYEYSTNVILVLLNAIINKKEFAKQQSTIQQSVQGDKAYHKLKDKHQGVWIVNDVVQTDDVVVFEILEKRNWRKPQQQIKKHTINEQATEQSS